MTDLAASSADAYRPIWMPDAQGFLAIAVVVLMFFIVGSLLLIDIDLDERVYGALLTLLGVIAGCFKDVYSWAFGSSKKEEKKDDTIASIASAPTPAQAPQTVAQLGETMLSNGDLTYFRTLTDEQAKKDFLGMSAAERIAAVGKT